LAVPKVTRRSVATEVATILDSPEVAELVERIDGLKLRKRRGYGTRTLIGGCLVRSIYALPTWTRTVQLIAEHAALAERYERALATGENLFSMQDARNLIRHGGLRSDRDILQFDPALSYGLVEYLRTLEMLALHGWSPRRCVPHGGHQFALNIAVGLGLGGNESYPQVFAPFGGFADDTPISDSRVKMPDIPGIGFEAKNDLYAVMKPLAEAAPAC